MPPPKTNNTTSAVGTSSSDRSVISDQAEAALNRAESVVESLGDRVEYYWDYLCDFLEDDDMPHFVRWFSLNVLRRLTVESPVIIWFCFTCVAVHVLQQTVWPGLNRFLAVQDTFDVTNPMQLPSLLTHVMAHDGSLGHIKGNMVHLLLVGPSAEHVYGSQTMLLVLFLVAVTSAAAHILVGGAHTHQLGASGVVFAVILLNSLVAAVRGTIPVSFLLTAGIWCSDELYKFLWGTDGVSHHAHLTGAIVGTVTAYYIRGGKSNVETKIEENKAAAPTPVKGKATVTPLQGWFRDKLTAIKTKTQ